ncbi:MAG: hypothetical protein M1355_03410 [Patescibacteria group bacterium]|nr:hypothetical protein [Patescibacteria group bacterium]
MATIFPKSKLGKWSILLIIAMPVLFFTGGLLANTLYKSVPAGAILEDITVRPFLSLSMLTGMACGISAFVTGMVAFIKQKERALLIYPSIAIGTLFVILLIGEFFVSH